MTIWSNFGTLSKLDFGFENVIDPFASIYGNGNNQVEIVTTVEVLDKENHPLNLSPNDLKDRVYLCDYLTGKQLESPWTVANDSNGYTKPVTNAFSSLGLPARNLSKRIQVSKYLSCAESNIEKKISVGIDIPEIGRFDTSQYGTETQNGPKGETRSPFKSPKFSSIKSLPKIDYGRPENILVRNMPKGIEDFETIVSDIYIKLYPKGKDGCSKYKELHNGIASKTKFTIEPKLKLSGYEFRTIDVHRNDLDVNQLEFFKDICPDMFRGIGGKNFDEQVVFVNRESCGLKSFFFMADTPSSTNYESCIYVIPVTYSEDDPRFQWTQELDKTSITVVIYNNRIPFETLKSSSQFPNQGTSIKVDVIDNYGNSGVVKIEAPPNDTWPQLSVNNALNWN